MNQSAVSEAMSAPSFYPGSPHHVERIETHISWVFIAGDDVYKVKKAVNFGFLDFTTLEKRRFYCEEEVRLNSRLAPEIYLGVTRIGLDQEGRMVLGGGATPLEYAVHMKKIPSDKMLKKLLPRQDFNSGVMADIAKKLALFHREAETGGQIDETGGIKTVRRNHEENFSQTEPFVGITLSAARHAFIRSFARRFLEIHADLFRKRVLEHRIRDCHGDLHLEHIVISGSDIIIFDCIEFNERFRYGDVAAEVSFLAMDLDFNGYAELSERFVEAYVAESGDIEIPFLVHFYKCYYAFVRGKVTGFRLHEPQISPEERTVVTETASRYFDLAFSYAARFTKPTLVIMAGLMGSGKSVVARELSRMTGASVIRMDVVRKELCNMDPRERKLDDFGQGIYSDKITELVYQKSLEQAKGILEAGKSVIIDASFKRKDHRHAAGNLADELKSAFFVIECVCPDDCIRKRLIERIKDQNEASDGRTEILDAQKEDFDAISEFPTSVHLLLDTSGKLDDSVDRIIAFVHKTD